MIISDDYNLIQRDYSYTLDSATQALPVLQEWLDTKLNKSHVDESCYLYDEISTKFRKSHQNFSSRTKFWRYSQSPHLLCFFKHKSHVLNLGVLTESPFIFQYWGFWKLMGFSHTFVFFVG